MAKNALLNRRFGPYYLLKRIGMGGMAEIYLALKLGPAETVKVLVLKCILSHYNHSKDFVHLFYHEAALSLLVQHPNLISTWDIAVIEKRPTMVMEYLDGVTLDLLLLRLKEMKVRMPMEICLWVGIQILDGLESFHRTRNYDGRALNAVHRDVTPHNVFCCYDGQCKLFDFGVARWGLELDDRQRGMLVGKYAYMSPEQCRGEIVDSRTDTFSLALVLYEMLTGVVPLERENDIKTLDAVNNAEIAVPAERFQGFPLALSKILMRALDSDRDKRFASAGDFATALRNFMLSAGISQDPESFKHYLASIFAEDSLDSDAFLRKGIEKIVATHRPAQLFGVSDIMVQDFSDSGTYGAVVDDLMFDKDASMEISISKLDAIRREIQADGAQLPKPSVSLPTIASALETNDQNADSDMGVYDFDAQSANAEAMPRELVQNLRRWKLIALLFGLLCLGLALAIAYVA